MDSKTRVTLWKRRIVLGLFEFVVWLIFPLYINLTHGVFVWWCSPNFFSFPPNVVFLFPLLFILDFVTSILTGIAIEQDRSIQEIVKIGAQAGVVFTLVLNFLGLISFVKWDAVVIIPIAPVIVLVVALYHGYITLEIPGSRADDFRQITF